MDKDGHPPRPCQGKQDHCIEAASLGKDEGVQIPQDTAGLNYGADEDCTVAPSLDGN